MMTRPIPPSPKRYQVFTIGDRAFYHDEYTHLLRDVALGLPPADECEFLPSGLAMVMPNRAYALKRFVLFVVLGNYSPCLFAVGLEPWPADTLVDRWRQWRALPRA